MSAAVSRAEELVDPEQEASQVVVEVPANATHWRVWRRILREDDDKIYPQRLSFNENSTAPRLTEWPIAEFSPLVLLERWGDGSYLVRFYEDQKDLPKKVHLSTAERIVIGVPSDELDDEEEEDEEDEDEEEETDETGHRVVQGPPVQAESPPRAVQPPVSFGQPYTSVPGIAGSVQLPPADLPPHLNVPLPSPGQLAALSPDPSTQALQLLTYHLSMFDRVNGQAERRLNAELERARIEAAAQLERERLNHQAQLTMQAQVHQQQLESSRVFAREVQRGASGPEPAQLTRAIRDAVREAVENAEERFDQRLEVAEAKAEQSTGVMTQVLKVVESLGPDVIRAVLPQKAAT